jgi:hypothetical protein
MTIVNKAATAASVRRGQIADTGDGLLVHTPLGNQFDRRSRSMRVRAGVAGAVAVALMCGACSSDSKGSSAAAATTPPTTAAAAPAPTTEAPTTTAAPAPKSPEADLVALARPHIDELTAALKAKDLAAAEEALEAYDAAWNGIEVYVNVRSLSMYLKLEADLQVGIEDGLAADAPDFAALQAMSEELAARYDDAIQLSKDGIPLNPLFDDVATLRIIRADLRITTSALGDGNVEKAKEHFTKFKEGFDSTVEPMLAVRDFNNEADTEAAVDAAADGFANAATSADDLTKLVAKVTSNYNFGVSLWNAAARNADDSKTEVTTVDLMRLGLLHDIRIQLTKSMNAWTAGDYERAGSVAVVAGTTVFDRVKPGLAAKGADTALFKLIDTYTQLAGAAGDAKEVGDANLAAVRGVAVAEQALLGQFWTDPKVQAFLDARPEVDPLAT